MPWNDRQRGRRLDQVEEEPAYRRASSTELTHDPALRGRDAPPAPTVAGDTDESSTSLYTDAPRAPNEPERVRLLDALDASSRGDSGRLKRITSLLSRMLSTRMAMISIIHSHEQHLRAVVGFNCSSTSRNSAFCVWTLLSDAPTILVVPDTHSDYRFRHNPFVVQEPFVRFYASAPVFIRGIRAGTLCVLDTSPRPDGLERWQLDLLASLARLVSAELSKEHISGKLATALEMCSEGFFLLRSLDEGCVIQYVNQGWTALTGYTRDESVGHQLESLLSFSNETEVLYAIESARQSTTTLRVDCKCQHNEQKSFRLSLCPVNNGALTPENPSPEHPAKLFIFGALLDITENVRLRHEANKQLEEAKAKEREKNSFLANVSHAVRTPLNAIISGSNLVLETTGLRKEQENLTSMIKRAGNQLLSLINDIIDFSRVDSYDMPLRRTWFQLHECIDLCMDMNGQKTNEKGLLLTYVVEEGVPWMLYNDDSRVRQVLTNLVSNATKFTEEGEVNVTVSLANDQHTSPPNVQVAQPVDSNMESCLLKFSVSDTGQGIAQKDRPKIFRHFSQADSTMTSRTGTGLGLAISSSIVRQMGGSIEFDSVEGEGTSFTFTMWGCRERGVSMRKRRESKLGKDKPVHIFGARSSFHKSAASLCKALSLRPESKDSKYAARLAKGEARVSDACALIVDRDEFEVSGWTRNQCDRAEVTNRIMDVVERSRSSTPLVIFTLDSPAQVSNKVTIQSKPMTLKSLRESLSPYFAALNTGSPSVGATSVIQRTQIEDESMKMKILVAEDNIVNQKVVKKMLLSLRYIADFVTNGQEALNNMKKTTRETVYDVILMDLQMPRMDGIEATKNIRKEVSDGLQPAIMALTADVAQHVPPLCKKAGMNGYVCKPVQKESLKEALSEVSRWKVRGRDPGELKSRLRWIAISDSDIKEGKRSESIDEARNRPMLEEKTATQ